jgi:hypothetical protein
VSLPAHLLHWITIDGETKLLSEWAREYGKSQELIRDRINRGWTEEMAVTKPARRYQTTGGSTDGMVGGRGQRAAGDDAEGETE